MQIKSEMNTSKISLRHMNKNTFSSNKKKSKNRKERYLFDVTTQNLVTRYFNQSQLLKKSKKKSVEKLRNQVKIKLLCFLLKGSCE